MCGILAIFGYNNTEIDNNMINISINLLKLRGPDSFNYIILNNNLLVFTRLSINDTSDNGLQPFIDNKNKVLICNGEIFNHKELEIEYKITDLITTSDCACILPLYEKLGFKQMIEKLDGDFALILIDNDNVYLARDRMGVRPLFVGKTLIGNKIAVASEAKVLDLFCYDIEQVIPGWRYFSLSNEYPQSIYSIPYNQISMNISILQDICTNINKLLTRAVEKRLMSDRPIGCLLSGGLDSSIITSILCRILGPHNVRTYSIGLEGSPDLMYAKKVADYLGTNHQEVIFTPQEGLDAIYNVIYIIESYDITTIRASVPMYLLAKYIKLHSVDKVIFSGEGSDELLCGYLYFHLAPSFEELNIESKRLLNNLYIYDVLRADRCVSSSGLELRVPFLDKDFVDYCRSLPGEIKYPMFKMEKYILRKSFENGYLPNDVLWRRKDGLSDACSSYEKPWKKYIQNYVKNFIIFDNAKYISEEAQYYHEIFMVFFRFYRPEIEHWMPKWCNINDPSGRLITI